MTAGQQAQTKQAPCVTEPHAMQDIRVATADEAAGNGKPLETAGKPVKLRFRLFGGGNSSSQFETVPSSFRTSTQNRACGFAHSILATTPRIVISLLTSNVAGTE